MHHTKASVLRSLQSKVLNAKGYGFRPYKLGTMPGHAHVHGADRVEVGRWIRIKECVGDKWHKVLVTRVDESGYFMADR
jgi:hypothetical protein